MDPRRGGFDRSLLHTYSEWESIVPDFAYHGLNCYAYLLQCYGTYDRSSLQVSRASATTTATIATTAITGAASDAAPPGIGAAPPASDAAPPGIGASKGSTTAITGAASDAAPPGIGASKGSTTAITGAASDAAPPGIGASKGSTDGAKEQLPHQSQGKAGDALTDADIGDTFDFVTIQLYEGYSHAEYNITQKQPPTPPAEYLLRFVKSVLAGWDIDYSTDTDLNYPVQRRMRLSQTQLVVGLANGWAGDGKFLLIYPEEVNFSCRKPLHCVEYFTTSVHYFKPHTAFPNSLVK